MKRGNSRFGLLILPLLLAGCCSYSNLRWNDIAVRVDGREVVATYEVVNLSHWLFGLIPLATGETWKEGPYDDSVGSMSLFCDHASLDDNMVSVRHACEIVGSNEIRNVTGQVDDYWAWSYLLVMKRVYKISCVIVK